MTDVVVTWPKSRPFGSYIAELENAKREGLNINYRVRNPPGRTRFFEGVGDDDTPRLYRVHDDKVRGYTPVLGVTFRDEGTVARVASDLMTGHWPAGWYIVCEPVFYDIEPVEMKGFRGWRWYDRAEVQS